MGEYDFVTTKVEIFNAETQKYDTLQLIDENELPFIESNPKTLNSDEIDDINLWIYIKDKYNISDQAWKEWAMKATDMPNAYRIKKNITDLNTKWKLKPTPGEAEGVQFPWRNKFKVLKLKEIWANKKQSGLKWVEMAPTLERDSR